MGKLSSAARLKPRHYRVESGPGPFSKRLDSGDIAGPARVLADQIGETTKISGIRGSDGQAPAALENILHTNHGNVTLQCKVACPFTK